MLSLRFVKTIHIIYNLHIIKDFPSKITSLEEACSLEKLLGENLSKFAKVAWFHEYSSNVEDECFPSCNKNAVDDQSWKFVHLG